ncbi:hypothetical protein [Aquabacterium sp. OR-4]|uniref:hypothetical protein n=1 Tax=Aquabacterium sp. OR-4 TaxID=2978127 RepID=UPI0021B402AB|nr:hypothetical protein [Aquabacterium sp. OR-4]MDT7837114.1 hypothetical protein [Aquabacterium sp. OR-4]
MKNIQGSGGARLRPGRVAGGVLASLAMLAAAGCGGGIESDSGAQPERLTCATTCKSSSSLAINQIRPAFAVVSDGTQAQAQAAFSTGSDLRFNVELDGGDSLRLKTAQGSQAFHIPGSSLASVVFDALGVLLTGARPYVATLTPTAGVMAVQFEFVRGETVYVASVSLPASHQIAAPAPGAQLDMAARNVAVSLNIASPVNTHHASFKCTDANGNTASESRSLGIVPDSTVRTATGVSYLLDIGSAIDRLSFTTTYARGVVARCDVDLEVSHQAMGLPDERFSTTQISARQQRKVAFTMR